jgi:gas vesicle protein
LAFTFAASGCSLAATPRGALIGAAAGAVLGTATGVAIGDEKLLGSSKASKLALGQGETVPAGLLIGTVFGAVVGAMIGHQNDHPEKAVHSAADTSAQPATAARNQAPTAF